MLSEMSFNSKWPKRQWLVSSPSTYDIIKLCPFNLSEPEVCDSFPVLKHLLWWTWPVASSLQHHSLLQGCCGQLCTLRTLSRRRRKGWFHLHSDALAQSYILKSILLTNLHKRVLRTSWGHASISHNNITSVPNHTVVPASKDQRPPFI